LNVLTLCKFLQLIDTNTFLSYANNIIQTSIVIVHSELIKKQDVVKTVLCELPRHITQNMSKNTNSVRQSNRKRILMDNDILLKGDIHTIFIENLAVKLLLN